MTLHPVAGVGLTAMVVSLLFVLARSDEGIGTLEVAERWTLDARFRLRGSQRPGPDVALVVMDDATATRAGPLLERRAGFAQVVRAAKAAGAAVIGLDAIFDVPERLLSEDLKTRIKSYTSTNPLSPTDDEPKQLVAAVEQELSGDAQLATALREAGNVVLILHATARGNGEPNLEAVPLSRAKYGQSSLGTVAPQQVTGFTTSIAELNAASKAQGFASATEDETRTVRRLSMARSAAGAVYLPFAVPVVAAFRGLNRGQLSYLGAEQRLQLGEQTVPLQDDSLWLNYRGPEHTFATYSAVDLVEGRVADGALRGKVVLLGITRLGYDVARTPFDSIPGVEVQATAIDNLLRADWLTRTTRTTELLSMLALGALAALLFITPRAKKLGARTQALALLAVAAGWLITAQWLFAQHRFWVPLVGPLSTVALSGVVGLVLSYAGEALERRQLKQAFGRYLGAEALDALLANPGSLRLGGERRTLTVLFSDIRDFTTLSEQLAPEKLVAVLNAYLSPMTRAVLAQGGLLDKYIGDAVMAVFGAPIAREDHAVQALTCVLAMHKQLAALNQGPLEALGTRIDIGVGLNTGDMVVGNMGSEERFDYTVVGDAVNLGSRLEALTKRYGVFCLVGDATCQRAGDAFRFRPLDLVQVKGKHAAVPVFELLAGPQHTIRTLHALDRWHEGIAAWRAAQLPEARVAFNAFAAENPGDAAAALYLERLAALPDQAATEFSPVAVFTSK